MMPGLLCFWYAETDSVGFVCKLMHPDVENGYKAPLMDSLPLPKTPIWGEQKSSN